MQNELRVRRAQRDVSQIDVAAAIGVSQSTYWRIENGYADPTPEQRAALARVLDTAEAVLFPEPVAVPSADGGAQA